MLGLVILVVFDWLGMLLNREFGIPLPGSVIGLILFTLALFMKAVKLEWVERTGQFLLRNMMLFFAPVIVGTMSFFSLFTHNGLPLVGGLVGGTLFTLAMTAAVTELLLAKEESGRESA